MGSCNPLYRVRVSSSGLIYAVIVGAWAAYLVPMWLRRQDELNEARPTERFSTAIRLLSGKAGMERRYAKDAERRAARAAREADGLSAPDARAEPGGPDDDAYRSEPDEPDTTVDVRAFADPKTMVKPPGSEAPTQVHRPRSDRDPRAPARSRTAEAAGPGGPARPGAHTPETDAERADAKLSRQAKRAKLLARRRRTTMVLFLAFTAGAVVAAVGGVALLWAPAVPAALLSAYIVYLRAQERRRFAALMDRRRAEELARRRREGRPPGGGAPEGGARREAPHHGDAPARPAQRHARGRSERPARGDRAPRAEADPYAGPDTEPLAEAPDEPREAARPRAEEQEAAERRAVVEQTDHAEWVDQQRAPRREHPEGEGWEPVPVPLPTYVSAPVAPRSTRGVDLEAPDTWSSARSSTVPSAAPEPRRTPPADRAGRPRRPRDRSRTPLFDQYEDPEARGDEDRPRAANE